MLPPSLSKRTLVAVIRASAGVIAAGFEKALEDARSLGRRSLIIRRASFQRFRPR
jgi:hypothetical protein